MLPSLATLTVVFPHLGHHELTWESSQFKSNAKRANKTMESHLAAKSGDQCRGREGPGLADARTNSGQGHKPS